MNLLVSLLLLCISSLWKLHSSIDTTLIRQSTSTCKAEVYRHLPADTIRTQRRSLTFSSSGIIPSMQTKQDPWHNIPEECKIDWKRHRKRFLPELVEDIALFFNTFDTTYVQRDEYDLMLRADNINFYQTFRLSAFNDREEHQVLTFAPTRSIKIGPYGGWRWLTLGYTFGVVPDRYKSKSLEFNIASYNSKVGFDLNYLHNSDNFNILRVHGFQNIEPTQLKGKRIEGMSCNTLAINLYYVFNYRHFSYPAAFSMTTVQRKSAGSWMAGLRYDRQHLQFDANKTERMLQTISPEVRLIDEMRFSNIRYRQLSLSLGYAYNWVPTRGLLVSISAAPSLGYKYHEGEGLSTSVLWRNIENFHFDAIIRGSIVWTTGRYYIGTSAVNYFYDYRHKGFILNNSIHYLRFYFGMYFKRKKFR